MVRKKIDNRIRILIENGVVEKHRTMFVIIGDKARDQVVLLHHMLSKSVVKARPNVLWCYKKDLGFSSHRKKRMKSIKNKAKAGNVVIDDEDPFQLFVASTNIRYCYYNETHKILGNTYGMCILQDFEALTPNLLARTVETVEGGGLVILLLQSLNSLKQLYTMSMDVHQRFRTEAHQNVVCRFNERFLLSLAFCNRCLVVDDNLRVLPISSKNLKIEAVQQNTCDDEQTELNILKESLQDTQPISALINCCKTVDQAKALLKFIETISEKTLRSTVSLTAARGRGKSATLGLAIAGAVAFGYSNIYVTSPSPENLKTLFEFIIKGFDVLAYEERHDYDLRESTNSEYNKAIVRVDITRDHRQTIQYINPTDAHKLSQAELLVIDEAAAIPLPYVKAMLGPYLVFLSSTINGYEGTGRSLSLKLLEQLRKQSAVLNVHNKMNTTKTLKSEESTVFGRQLYEITLDESIRYKRGDKVEEWLTNLLCLDATTHPPIRSGCPPPNACQLYYINRDTLFSYHKASEIFLQRLVALYVASHYKNSPNDLQIMSDAPAHHLFCLLGPVNPDQKALPEILVIIQVCLEGELSKDSVVNGFGKGRRAAGDLIPWTLAQYHDDNNFPQLAGARIVRIATHPDYCNMGYGTRALELLKQYYEMKIPNVDDEIVEEECEQEIEHVDVGKVDLLQETIEPRASLPPLLINLSKRRPERLNYLGVSFGLTAPLLKFWKRSNFIPLYLRTTSSGITGEHSCIMLSKIIIDDDNEDFEWMAGYWMDFRREFMKSLSREFMKYSPALALSVLTNKNFKISQTTISKQKLDDEFSSREFRLLKKYSNNMADYNLIMSSVSSIAKLYLENSMNDTSFSPVQIAILLGLGLQHKTIDKVAAELDILPSQLLAQFNQSIRISVEYLTSIAEQYIEKTMFMTEEGGVNDDIKVDVENGKNMQKELEDTAEELLKKQKKELQKLKNENLNQYAIKGSEEEWSNVLKGKKLKSLVSVKSGEKRLNSTLDETSNFQLSDDRKTKKKKRFSK